MQMGEKIRVLRKQLGKTLEDVAFAAGTDSGNLSRIERGHQGCSVEMLSRIAEAMGVSVTTLLDYCADKSPSFQPADPKSAQPLPLSHPVALTSSSEYATLNARFARLTLENQHLALDLLQCLLHRQTGDQQSR